MKNNNTPKEVLEARENYQTINIHCPHLDENMQPFPELLNTQCPLSKDGKCGKCENFIGYWSEDGAVFACGAYEGFCDCKNK